MRSTALFQRRASTASEPILIHGTDTAAQGRSHTHSAKAHEAREQKRTILTFENRRLEDFVGALQDYDEASFKHFQGIHVGKRALHDAAVRIHGAGDVKKGALTCSSAKGEAGGNRNKSEIVTRANIIAGHHDDSLVRNPNEAVLKSDQTAGNGMLTAGSGGDTASGDGRNEAGDRDVAADASGYTLTNDGDDIDGDGQNIVGNAITIAGVNNGVGDNSKGDGKIDNEGAMVPDSSADQHRNNDHVAGSIAVGRGQGSSYGMGPETKGWRHGQRARYDTDVCSS